jgi:hypothetical protein
VILSQGRRYTDYDGIHFGDECEIYGRMKSAISGRSYFRRRNTTDVGPPRGKHVDLGAVDIEPVTGKPSSANSSAKRKANVAQADADAASGSRLKPGNRSFFQQNGSAALYFSQ